MKRPLIALAAAFAFAPFAVAQLTPDEAMQRIQQEHAQEANDPASTQSDVALLRSTIADQQNEIQQLKAEIAALKKQIVELKTPPAPPQPPQGMSTYESRFAVYASKLDSSNLEYQSIPHFTKITKETDMKIAAYVAANKLEPEMVEALYKGIPKIGLPEDALTGLFICDLRSESGGSRTYDAGPPCAFYAGHFEYSVTVSGGKVIEIDVVR